MHATDLPDPVPDPAVRLVYAEFGLAELFAAQSGAKLIRVDELADAVVGRLRAADVRRLLMPPSSLLGKTGLAAAIESAGFEMIWTGVTLPPVACDGAVFDAYAAIAESGSVVFRPTPGVRAALLAKIRVVVIEPNIILPDWVDLPPKLDDTPGEAWVISPPHDWDLFTLY